MVVPFSEPAEKSCRKKEIFNKKLRRGRVQVIECGVGVWKQEFPVLLIGITAKSPDNDLANANAGQPTGPFDKLNKMAYKYLARKLDIQFKMNRLVSILKLKLE